MKSARFVLLFFVLFLGLVIYTADTGSGDRYWGWLKELPLGDKVGQFCSMSTFCLLVNLSTGWAGVRVIRGTPLWGTLLVTILVVSGEFSQQFFPSRSFDLLDLMADLIGIGCGDPAARWIHTTSIPREV
jgi:polysaccharide biosynthesis protein VpsQ